MSKFIVDLWLDGYETEEDMTNACEEFIYENLNCTASSIKIEKINETNKALIVNLNISDIDDLKQYLDYLKNEIEISLNSQVQGLTIELMDYDTFKRNK